MNAKVKGTLVTLTCLGVLTSCGEPTTPAAPGSPSASYDGTWQLFEGHGPKGEVAVIDGYRITLTLEGEDASGTAACNSYGGTVEIQGDSFAFHGGGMTEMACRSDVMEAESAYLAALEDAKSTTRSDDTLRLTGADTKLRFELRPPVPTAQLLDTRWELESLIYGSSADSMASSATPAHLVLHIDGTVTASSGCRELTGEWVESGDEITFTRWETEGACPDELRQQDNHIVGVLGDGFTVEIEGDRLTVFSSGGLGLVYRAAD